MNENKNFNVQNIIDKAKTLWGDFLAGIKKQGKDGKKLEISFGVNKQSYFVALGILGVMVIVSIVAGLFVWNKNTQLTEKTWDLKELKYYNLSDFQNSEAMAEEKDDLPQTIDKMIEDYQGVQTEKTRIEGELNFKKSVYSEFLRNLLLPSLNIWKDPYTKELDISLLGKKYLDTNPYQDISLLSQWSSIIKESGKDVGDNEVVNMKIGDIQELDNGFFTIPISISFRSDSKRAFLLLVDKLSLTSNINNLGLLNDFSYYLFNAIREEKSDEVQQLITDYKVTKPADQDEKTFNNSVISRYLYSWIFSENTDNILIDENIIDRAIKQSAVCGNSESIESCYFRFRNKYRTIPGLAYGIGLETLVNKPLALKDFYANIPPLIAIESFTFDKAKAQGLSLANNNEYLGNVNFSIYGRGITPADANEISNKLTEACFGSGSTNALDISGALAPVQRALEDIGVGNKEDNIERMGNMIELRDLLLEEAKDFDALSPYNKMIKKFEFYRMLQNLNLCK